MTPCPTSAANAPAAAQSAAPPPMMATWGFRASTAAGMEVIAKDTSIAAVIDIIARRTMPRMSLCS